MKAMYPSEEGRFERRLHNFLLKAYERLESFAVDRGHVDVEEAQQGVRLVLEASRVPFGCPCHALCDAVKGVVHLAGQDAGWNTSDVLKERGKLSLVPEYRLPIPRYEDNKRGRDELLESPSAEVPPCCPERGVGGMQIAIAIDIAHVYVTYLGAGIPEKHGVDGLGQLAAARLVDAACVVPDPAVAVALG